MDILTDKTTAYVDIDFLGLVSLLDATLDDIGTDGIALIVILVDIICQLIEGGADCLVGRLSKRVFGAAPGKGTGGDLARLHS